MSTDYTTSLWNTDTILYKTDTTNVNVIRIDTDTRECGVYSAYETPGTPTNYDFFDETHNRCGNIDVSAVKKYPESATYPNQVFVDLGMKTCIYSNIHGHLTDFVMDRTNYFAQDFLTADSRDSTSLL